MSTRRRNLWKENGQGRIKDFVRGGGRDLKYILTSRGAKRKFFVGVHPAIKKVV